MVKEMEALKNPGLQFEENDEGGGYKWSLKKKNILKVSDTENPKIIN